MLICGCEERREVSVWPVYPRAPMRAIFAGEVRGVGAGSSASGAERREEVEKPLLCVKPSPTRVAV